MKKILIAGLILILCGLAYAGIQITYNVPVDFGKELLDALIATSNCHIKIEAWELDENGNHKHNGYKAVIDFTMPEYDPNWTDVIFVKKSIARYADAIRQMHKRKLKTDIREAYLADAPDCDVNEPEPNEMDE